MNWYCLVDYGYHLVSHRDHIGQCWSFHVTCNMLTDWGQIILHYAKCIACNSCYISMVLASSLIPLCLSSLQLFRCQFSEVLLYQFGVFQSVIYWINLGELHLESIWVPEPFGLRTWWSICWNTQEVTWMWATSGGGGLTSVMKLWGTLVQHLDPFGTSNVIADLLRVLA